MTLSGYWSQFEKEFLAAHNDYRQQHGAPALKLSRDLSEAAQEWAEHLLKIRALKHGSTGENLYFGSSSTPKEVSGKDAVGCWYSEIKDYDFSKPGFGFNTGHFTQVVWKSSTEVGVGKATDGKMTFVVGRYSPPGNISNPGYFQENVLPKGSSVGKEMPSSGTAPTAAALKKPGSAPARPPPSAGQSSGFKAEVLEAHNAYRRQHGAPPLRLDAGLCRESQEWANHLLSLRALQHSDTSYGENIWYKWSSNKTDATGEEIVESWYNESKDYDFKHPGFQSNTGHFTQVVWVGSQRMGIGKATDGEGMVIAVARYDPAGNISNAGYFEKNVLPKGTPPAGGASGDPEPKQKGNGAASAGNSRVAGSGSFVQGFLESCNERRSAHGAKPLTENPEISRGAESWARHLLSLHRLKHSTTSHGENIWAKMGGADATLTGQEVVDTWYEEMKNYDFSQPGYQEKTGHFTQLVWRGSRTVGVGSASDGKGTVIVVAQFQPPGNITNPGFYARNVLPAGSKVTDQPEEEAVGKKTVGGSVAPIPEKELDRFSLSLLDTVNRFRKQHGAGPLKRNPALSKEAQDWAEHLLQIKALQSSDTEHGENLWYRWASSTAPPTGTEVAESWYKECSKYDFSSPGFTSGAGNFTQMIWRASLQVGTGVATDGKGMFIAVAFYDPPGNIANEGYFQDNVLPKGSVL
ncbi:uncharacterized protein LOC121309627 [Polyodon spathula]|uniref:uncharacterized protein LOC121309627 n=1 Tax=Polyodon spathula TaxID=7913 RepID=UPI001B7D9FDB|nr:uncharacterized protein LOC121309627 [Polyodon spathula]XP_041098588.1 uncharacterized protein LOC121309627 [Polyodon spathula]XP_041098589.1 uncharacterized protein LOC121309627 [Polyodon spathula]XP_041098590.1 uncharacterized protein LOC121309627 [Polyodon spathula]XP_041098591.1 uncharacterized protein LOC121309627 [Polyodon spathula]